MSIERTKMTESLKELFVPELKSLNFNGSFPHFRRTIGDKTNLLTFQFDRHGGGFIIEIANFQGTKFKTNFGERIQINKLTAHDINDRKRIYPNILTEEKGTENWFRFDKISFLPFRNKYDRLAKKLIKKLPIMKEYWNEI